MSAKNLELMPIPESVTESVTVVGVPVALDHSLARKETTICPEFVYLIALPKIFMTILLHDPTGKQ